jgi:hypothetical protein
MGGCNYVPVKIPGWRHYKLLKIFGATEATRAVSGVRNTAAKEKRAKKRTAGWPQRRLNERLSDPLVHGRH